MPPLNNSYRIKMKLSLFGDVDWKDLDFLVIDLSLGLGDEPLTAAQMIKEALAISLNVP